MSYDAKIFEVMIASPSDVTAERQIVRDILNDWNVMHARARQAFLVPVAWETHSAPELGGRPQQMINDRLLTHCDLLVGIFWARLGSPTGVSTSGTVEEIENHRKYSKPVMLYFSGAPVMPDSIDHEQYAQLKEFKAWAKTQGLVAEYANLEEFRERLRRDLELNFRDNVHLSEQLARAETKSSSSNALQAQRVTLTSEETALLEAAAASEDGEIFLHESYGGTQISAGRKVVLEEGATAREVAKWRAAIDKLERYDLIEPANYKREIFRLTHAGFEVAAQLADTTD